MNNWYEQSWHEQSRYDYIQDCNLFIMEGPMIYLHIMILAK